MTTTQDPAGWAAICRHCNATYVRFNPDRATRHHCQEATK